MVTKKVEQKKAIVTRIQNRVLWKRKRKRYNWATQTFMYGGETLQL